jgi:hypothetical protein
MDSGSIVDEKITASSFEKIALNDNEEDDEQISYGELILLGYNGSLESSRPNSHGRKHRSKMSLNQRQVGNGIKKGQSTEITVNPKQAPVVQDNTRHVVSYVHKSHTVLVEYVSDPGKDMFQVCKVKAINELYYFRSEGLRKSKSTLRSWIRGWQPELISYFLQQEIIHA